MPQYSNGRYEGAQRDAERAGRGIWKDSNVEPWLYRARIRVNEKPPYRSDDANAHP
jgi:endonuclease YncB( thermonuclease family)